MANDKLYISQVKLPQDPNVTYNIKDTEAREAISNIPNQTVKGNGTAFGANDAVNIVGGTNVTVTPNTTNKTITIAATDTKPNDATLTLQVAGTTKATFTADDADNATFNVTAADLGLSQALVFKGITTTNLTDGATTNPITLEGGTSLTPTVGTVVITSSSVSSLPNTEFVWASSKWNKLGDAKSYALNSVTVTGTGALGGGGNLTANRTITHNAGSAANKTEGLYKISTDAYSHVASATAVTKSDITALGIPESDTDTWRGINVNGSSFKGTGTGTGLVNFKAGSNVSLSTSGNDITINSTGGEVPDNVTYFDNSTSTTVLNETYLLASQRGVASGVAELDGSGKVPANRIPDLSGFYMTQALRGAANGVAPLDSTGKVPAGNIGIDLSQYATSAALSTTNSNVSALQALTSDYRHITAGTGDPTGGSDGDIYIKYVD